MSLADRLQKELVEAMKRKEALKVIVRRMEQDLAKATKKSLKKAGDH